VVGNVLAVLVACGVFGIEVEAAGEVEVEVEVFS
jgi:hypothetical protein